MRPLDWPLTVVMPCFGESNLAELSMRLDHGGSLQAWRIVRSLVPSSRARTGMGPLCE